MGLLGIAVFVGFLGVFFLMLKLLLLSFSATLCLPNSFSQVKSELANIFVAQPNPSINIKAMVFVPKRFVAQPIY